MMKAESIGITYCPISDLYSALRISFQSMNERGKSMLGEDHSLLHDFSEHKDKIISLTKNDNNFKKMADDYHKLDVEIRELELDKVPVADDYFNELKHKRSELKNILYSQLNS